MSKTTIVWFRQDLRLSDNPAFAAAVESGGPVLPLYVLDDESPGEWRLGGASRWWLHHSLSALAHELKVRSSTLVLRRGHAAQVVPELAAEIGADAVVWNRCYEPWVLERDRAMKAGLRAVGMKARSFNAALLVDPWEVETQGGEPFRVFTPFWRAVTKTLSAAPIGPPPPTIAGLPRAISSEHLDTWRLLPTTPDWSGGLRAAWTPGERGAQARLRNFLDDALGRYENGRDRPDLENTSCLSPHLHWGEISPRQIWAALDHTDAAAKDIEKFRSELGWREFSYHLLFHSPTLPMQNLRPEFNDFPWDADDATRRAWQRGTTGFPIVDAGMRQLWATGWMHNRVRMIAASLLVKHLLQPWQTGARWFWDTLVDADLANNSASWQWVAGCGADAAPYFRIFNPVLQGEKFDPDGGYVRRWVPELAKVPARFIHKPWTMPDRPPCYPLPIIDLAVGRKRALAAFETIKKSGA